MSLPRLPFLYPHLFKSLHTSEAQPVLRQFRKPRSSAQRQSLHGSSRLCQEAFVQRYGPAAEAKPPPQSSSTPKDAQPPKTVIGGRASPVRKAAPQTSSPTKAEGAEGRSNVGKAANASSKAATASQEEETKSQPIRSEPADPTPSGTTVQNSPPKSLELEKVFHMQAPASIEGEEHKPPHLHTPPYVHHFDSYSLVKDLEKGEFTGDQSITIMKAVRGLLALNLDVAKEGLVSKSDVENETYLFRAACSELRTEIQNSRNTSSNKMRTERAHLQHEADILNQKVTQESLTLKDDLRGMFNDRKMAVRMEQRAMESAIQELNYKISVALNSDSKGEVEGLRWFLTRRAALFIASMALLILGSLRYSSYMIHMQAQERHKIEQEQRAARSSGNGNDNNGGSYTVQGRSAGTQTESGDTSPVLAMIDAGSSPNFVSLG